MSKPRIDRIARAEEEHQGESDAFCVLVRIGAERKILNRGIFVFEALRVGLVAEGLIIFTLCTLPFVAGAGKLLPISARISIAIVLIFSVGVVLAPIWLKGRLAALRRAVGKLDSQERAVATAGLNTLKAKKQIERLKK